MIYSELSFHTAFESIYVEPVKIALALFKPYSATTKEIYSPNLLTSVFLFDIVVELAFKIE